MCTRWLDVFKFLATLSQQAQNIVFVYLLQRAAPFYFQNVEFARSILKMAPYEKCYFTNLTVSRDGSMILSKRNQKDDAYECWCAYFSNHF